MAWSLTWIVGHILTLGIGVTLGLLGGGGSVLALPVLVYVMGIGTKTAIPMTLIIVGTVSALGVIPHWRRGNINLRAALVFGSATMVGAFLGAKLAGMPFITPGLQMTLFAIAMFLAAGILIYRTSKKGTTPEPETPNPALYTPPVCKYCWMWLPTEGLGVGILTGLVGVGGGFAIVPALVILGKVPMRQAIGTSLFIIAANSAAGVLGYLGEVPIDWHLTVSFTFAAGLGTVLGSWLMPYIPVSHLQKGFGYFLLAVASFVLFQNFQASPKANSREYREDTHHSRYFPNSRTSRLHNTGDRGAA